jgi:glycerol-3-phosphate acyltransferase PlsY
MWDDVLIIIGAYFLGAFPIVYLLGRMRGVDLSKEEDMHISLWRKVGRREALIGIIWDVVKGGVAVVIVQRVLHYNLSTVVGVGLAVVVGLMWPIFLKFRGEKANTTGLGMAAALAYQALPFILVPAAIGAGIRTLPRFFGSRQPLNERLRFGGPPSLSLPLAMLIGFGLLPLGCWIMGLSWEITIACLILFILIVIKRLTAGLREDLKTAANKKSVLINRALFDRSYI